MYTCVCDITHTCSLNIWHWWGCQGRCYNIYWPLTRVLCIGCIGWSQGSCCQELVAPLAAGGLTAFISADSDGVPCTSQICRSYTLHTWCCVGGRAAALHRIYCIHISKRLYQVSETLSSVRRHYQVSENFIWWLLVLPLSNSLWPLKLLCNCNL